MRDDEHAKLASCDREGLGWGPPDNCVVELQHTHHFRHLKASSGPGGGLVRVITNTPG